MKKSRLHKNTETTVPGEKKAKQYMAGSESSCKGLIGETDSESCANSEFPKYCSSTILIEVRQTPFGEKSYEEMKSSSDSDDSIKENCDMNKAKRTALYTDITGSSRPDLQYDKQSEMAELPEPTMKVKIENERYKAEYKSEQTDLTNHNINRQMANSRAPLYSRNHRRWTTIFSCKYRCILYFFIACCISILFASFISYLSYRE